MIKIALSGSRLCQEDIIKIQEGNSLSIKKRRKITTNLRNLKGNHLGL